MEGVLEEVIKEGMPYDVQQLFMRYTMDSIGELGFGININSLQGNKEAMKFSTAFDYVQAKSNFRYFIHPLWKLLPQRKFNDSIEKVDSFMKNIIQSRRQEVTGDNISGITFENIAKMKYMKQVIDETLRLYPPLPLDERSNVKDDVLPSGLRIPTGTMVLYSAYAQHRLAEYFPNPEKFDPDRWATDTIKPYSFVPFHGGPRICLGQNMAYQEIKIALSVLIRRFKFTLVKDFPVKFGQSVTLPARYGMLMNVDFRK